ncbi:SLAM family member 5 isoform X2 [Pseudorasbora parva]
MSSWRIVLFCIMYIQQVFGDVKYTTGYLNQSVILKSGADGSRNLTKVQWSIYPNTTFIAALKDGEVTIYKFWRYSGRLELNNRTGDLTIKNLTMTDGITYTVIWLSSNDTRERVDIHLTVQERLKEPKIQKTLDSLKDGQCHIALNCNAFNQNVNLSWTPDREFNGSYISGNAVDSSLVIFMSFSGNRNVTVNCTASSGQQTETKQMKVGCSELQKQKCEECTVCGSSSSGCSCSSSVIGAMVLTILAVLLLLAAYKWREKIHDFIQKHR